MNKWSFSAQLATSLSQKESVGRIYTSFPPASEKSKESIPLYSPSYICAHYQHLKLPIDEEYILVSMWNQFRAPCNIQ